MSSATVQLKLLLCREQSQNEFVVVEDTIVTITPSDTDAEAEASVVNEVQRLTSDPVESLRIFDALDFDQDVSMEGHSLWYCGNGTEPDKSVKLANAGLTTKTVASLARVARLAASKVRCCYCMCGAALCMFAACARCWKECLNPPVQTSKQARHDLAAAENRRSAICRTQATPTLESGCRRSADASNACWKLKL